MDNVRLPDHIERGSRGGPGFLTIVAATSAGKEQRGKEWAQARQKWNVGYGVMGPTDFDEVRDFFYARNGRHRGFLFKDWTDYGAIDEAQGFGDGANDDFQLIKTYGDAGNTYIRLITRPVAASLIVKANGAIVLPADYTLGALGLVTFDVAPALGVAITATFEFDIPVRFDIDDFEMSVLLATAASVPNIPIVELKEP